MIDFKSGQQDQSNSSWQDNYLKDILHKGEVKVKFIKKDGTERDMRCTLKPDLLPEQESTEAKKEPNPDVMKVWDLEKNAWRSFRFDSIIGFSENV